MTPRSPASHLGLNCLLRPVCSNTYGKYGIYFFSIRHVEAILWKCLCKAITMSTQNIYFFGEIRKIEYSLYLHFLHHYDVSLWRRKAGMISLGGVSFHLKAERLKNYLHELYTKCFLNGLGACTVHVSVFANTSYAFEDRFMWHIYTKHIRNDTGHQVCFIPNKLYLP